ncbi:apoptosis-stimulating of p53 protein 1 [Uranotaenia lowii]|uniref:apoptosis-stimulating of p53 protein 1 n=1 Tax=Uranotaenia lowii TaxID=190385 RepID=UPI00247A2A8E|nr:apoptosis-stimulating of p53 protein 1 [Uranotaenia lowii]
MREPNNFEEVTPVRLNTSELRIMALRQQQQIDTQQQLLAAREQRLRFLKAQEACDTVAAVEGERLRRLRERVEAQESKLRRLRALRGQVDLQKTYNVTLGNDLDSIRALFSEKEKELTLAVAKVEALTRQLEDLRRDRRGALNLFSGIPNNPQINNSPAALELDKLRRELMYRNQLSLQQDARLHLQREALQKRQAELQSVDQRILELQGRLHKKRSSIMLQHQQNSPQNSQNNVIIPNHTRSISSNFYPQQRVPRSNIVAVEPFSHIPQKTTALGNNGNKINIMNNSGNSTIQGMIPNSLSNDLSNCKPQHTRQLSAELFTTSSLNDNDMAPESDENKLAAKQKKQEHLLKTVQQFENEASSSTLQALLMENSKLLNGYDQTNNNINNSQVDEFMFGGKYYNTDRSTDNIGNIDLLDNIQHASTNDCDSDKVSDMNGISTKATTVHSTPLMFLNKSVATPVRAGNSSNSGLEDQNLSTNPKSTQGSNRNFAHNLIHTIPSGNLVVPPRKPNNVVSPMSNSKLISSETKVNFVIPQAQLNHISHSAESADKLKPALPPKPYKNNNQNQETDTQNFSESNIDQSGNNASNNASKLNNNISDNLPIKAKPLTIKKSPYSEQPRLKQQSNNGNSYKLQLPGVHRMVDMHMLAEMKKSEENDASGVTLKESEKNDEPSKLSELNGQNQRGFNKTDNSEERSEQHHLQEKRLDEISRRKRSFVSAVISDGKIKLARRVSFDPLALLLDASLEGELELVQKTALQVPNPSAANDEGITALHNAICAGHVEIVRFLVGFGCDVNAQDSDGWTPLHCAASCNNLSMVKFLVESGACLFAATLSDHETPAEKCEEDEEGFDGCSEYLYSVQEKLGILNNGEVFAVFCYDAQQADELTFSVNDKLTVVRKGDESEREWWWAKDVTGREGYIPRNLLGLFPRVSHSNDNQNE